MSTKTALFRAKIRPPADQDRSSAGTWSRRLLDVVGHCFSGRRKTLYRAGQVVLRAIVERDANSIFFLERNVGDSTAVTLRIAKQRNGSTDELNLGFDGDRFQFIDSIEASTNREWQS